jgi:hypothetical protein
MPCNLRQRIRTSFGGLTILLRGGAADTHRPHHLSVHGERQAAIEIKQRLGKIETLLMEEQKQKLKHLKARVKRLEDALAICI